MTIKKLLLIATLFAPPVAIAQVTWSVVASTSPVCAISGTQPFLPCVTTYQITDTTLSVLVCTITAPATSCDQAGITWTDTHQFAAVAAGLDSTGVAANSDAVTASASMTSFPQYLVVPSPPVPPAPPTPPTPPGSLSPSPSADWVQLHQ